MTSRISVRDAAITVRPVVPEDAEKLRELRLAALATYREAFAMDAESVATETVAHWVERITRNIATRAGTICVAVDGDQLIGMMGLFRRSQAQDPAQRYDLGRLRGRRVAWPPCG